jgi:hypothetical protein
MLGHPKSPAHWKVPRVKCYWLSCEGYYNNTLVNLLPYMRIELYEDNITRGVDFLLGEL